VFTRLAGNVAGELYHTPAPERLARLVVESSFRVVKPLDMDDPGCGLGHTSHLNENNSYLLEGETLQIRSITLLLAAGLALSLAAGSLAAQETSPVRVVMPVESGLSEQLLLSGTLTARQDANLSSRAAGLVSELLVDIGDQVEKGQPLLRLDPALARHELSQRTATAHAAKVARDEAQRQVDEAEKLAGQKLFPQTELELRRAALAQAGATLEQAEAAAAQQQEILTRHTLTAPFSGVIAGRSTDIGEYVSLGTPVLQLVAPAPLLLDVQVPQEYYPALPRLQRITVRADIAPEREFAATLISAVPVGDATARSFQARVQLEDDGELLPGTSAAATFHFQQGNGAIMVVPPDALLRHPDGNFSLFTVRDSTAWRHVITVGRSNEQGVEILSGLPAGEPVVIRGNEILRDGQAVRITNTQD
jgi:RND family efflux transporter MFP subunit